MVRELFTKIYTRINWKNRSEAMTTPLGKTLLNRMDYTLDELDSRIAALDVLKAEESEVLQMVKEWSMDEETGIITITKKNGEKIMFDLNIEKIPVSFTLSPQGILTMTTDDGTKFTADIGSMIPVLTFKASDTVSIAVEGEGKNKTYSFSVKEGSIKDKHLQPSYLADIKVQAQAADKSAGKAQTEADRAKTEADRAKTEADKAEQAAESVGALGAVIGVKGSKEEKYRQGNVNIKPEDIGAVKKEGDTMTGTLASSKTSGTYLAGNQGQAIINSTAGAGAYTILDKLNSTNGYFTDGVYQGRRILNYTAKSTVDANTNTVTKSATLLDEAGNSSFPGTVSAQGFNGNATSATEATKAMQDGLGNVITDTYLEKMCFRPHAYFYADAYDAAKTVSIDTGLTNMRDCNRKDKSYDYSIFLIVGEGCSATASVYGVNDFFKASLIFPLKYASNADDTLIFKEIPIGSSGSTARYTFAATKNYYKSFDIKIPKGSLAAGQIYKLTTQDWLV